ncbi:hypothetical protein ACWHLZ_32345 [Streptomyces chartreusis]
MVRINDGVNPRPVAVILDSQSVKGAETVSQDTRGFDGGKLIKAESGTASATNCCACV